MTSFYGLNIHAQGLRSATTLIEHVIKTKPAFLLVMDGLGLALQLKVASPETNVIHRNYGVTNGDGDVFARYTPQAWLDAHKADIEAGVWLMTTVEPGWGADVIKWHVDLMRLCITPKIKLVVGNFSVGTPDPNNLELALPLFRMLADHRDQFVLGLHEYANAVITSGFVGGAPNGADEAGSRVHPDYIPPESWPLNGEARILTKWHCGRFEFITKYCKLNGINPPRMVMTEAGFDDVSDIKWWTKNLPHTAPYADIGGFKSLQNFWHMVFPQWSQDQAYWRQLEYAENNIYAGTTVEGALLYCYGHIDPRWEAFDLEGYSEFLAYMEAHAVATQPVQPSYTIPPIVANSKYIVNVPSEYINVRKAPVVTTTAPLATLKTGDVVIALEEMISGGEYWVHVNKDTDGVITDGWISLQQGQVRLVAYVPPVITLPPPPEPPAPFLEVSAQMCQNMIRAYTEQATAKQRLATAYTLGAQDDLTMAQQWKNVLEQIEPKAA